MSQAFSPSFPGEKHAAPVGTHHDKPVHRCCARVRRPRTRLCLRKGCGHRYVPRQWNQRYCQDPACQREVRRWQAARRQAKRREDAASKAEHAQAERVRRSQAKSASQPVNPQKVAPARGHATPFFFDGFVSSAGLLRCPCQFATQSRLLLLCGMSPGCAERRGPRTKVVIPCEVDGTTEAGF